MPQIDSFLQMAAKARASDLHLAVGEPPCVRQFSQLKKVKSKPLTRELLQTLVYEILQPGQRKIVEDNHQIDFSYEIKGVARFRGSVVNQRSGLAAAFRVIPAKIPPLDTLGLPEVARKVLDSHQGLILVTGAAGHGKSTTLAAMIDYVNSRRSEHVVTVEDPIEFVHPVKKGLVNQRQVGVHTLSFSNALRAAMREDPDVVMVGELRDLESISLTTTAAETGHLVMATLSTSSGPKTISRLVDAFPPEEQNQVRMTLADGLRAVITQMLVPKADGTGLVLATEVMIGTLPLSNLIRHEKLHQIPSVMQTGRAVGMQSMDESLLQLAKDGKITMEVARDRAIRKDMFQ